VLLVAFLVTKEKMREGKYCRLHFRVKALTQLGQVVGVAGSSTTLGNYDTKKVIKLVTTPDSYPIWYTTDPIVVPRGRSFSYCFCILEGGIFKAYELNSPRNLIAEKVDILIEEIFHPNQLLGMTGKSTTHGNSGGDGNSNRDAIGGNIGVMNDENESFSYELKSSESTESLASLDSLADRTIYITCYHLPVHVRRISSDLLEPNGPHFEVTWNNSLISMRGDETIFQNFNKYWIGTVSIHGEPLTSIEEIELTEILSNMKCIPLYLEQSMIRDAYYGYCKQVLWPIFHNIEHLDSIHAIWNIDRSKNDENGLIEFWNLSNEIKYFNAYKNVTNAFKNKLMNLVNHINQDIIWVHDYHLMLLPGLLRPERPLLKIIFFLHIPFPTSQVFRSLPTALEILNSMCSSDIIGFHTFDYCRHFLHAIRRMLGYRFHSLPGGLLAVTMKDHEFVISMSHVSIEPSLLSQILSDDQTQNLIQNLKFKYLNKKIFVGVDVCERLSGCILKLEAYRMFLEDTDDPTKYLLIMYVIKPNLRPLDEEYTSLELIKLVNEINIKYHHIVIEYIEQESMLLPYQRYALWSIGDVYLLTSIREGLNFMPLEYIYIRKDLIDPGVVVASEFSTCSALLNGSMKINPFNFRNVADILHKAIHMNLKEKEGRRKRDLTFVQTHTSAKWINQILLDLSTKESLSMTGGHHHHHLHHHHHGGGATSGASGGSDVYDDENDIIQESLPLQISDALAAYENAMTTKGLISTGTRVFIFDYGGTIVAYEKVDVYMKQTLHSMSSLPTPEMMCALKKLSEDENNCILINTSLSRKKLGSLFDDFVNVTIATSSGLICSWGRNIMTIDEKEDLKNEEETHSYLGSVASLVDEEGEEGEGGEGEDAIFHTVEGTSSPLSPHGTPQGQAQKDQQDHEEGEDAEDLRSSRSRDLHRESFSWTRQHHETFLTDRTWDHMDLSIDWDTVKNIAIPIMSKFTTRTNGTCMTPRVPGIGWNYFGADPEWGEKQVIQLKIELETALVNHDVRIVLLPGSLDIVPRTFHKGVIISEFLRRISSIRAGKLPSFILVAGNEPNDNKMFDVSDDLWGGGDLLSVLSSDESPSTSLLPLSSCASLLVMIMTIVLL
jgi:trehalose 6-phosphate synthase/phosphatase